MSCEPAAAERCRASAPTAPPIALSPHDEWMGLTPGRPAPLCSRLGRYERLQLNAPENRLCARFSSSDRSLRAVPASCEWDGSAPGKCLCARFWRDAFDLGLRWCSARIPERRVLRRRAPGFRFCSVSGDNSALEIRPCARFPQFRGGGRRPRSLVVGGRRVWACAVPMERVGGHFLIGTLLRCVGWPRWRASPRRRHLRAGNRPSFSGLTCPDPCRVFRRRESAAPRRRFTPEHGLSKIPSPCRRKLRIGISRSQPRRRAIGMS